MEGRIAPAMPTQPGPTLHLGAPVLLPTASICCSDFIKGLKIPGPLLSPVPSCPEEGPRNQQNHPGIKASFPFSETGLNTILLGTSAPLCP